MAAVSDKIPRALGGRLIFRVVCRLLLEIFRFEADCLRRGFVDEIGEAIADHFFRRASRKKSRIASLLAFSVFSDWSRAFRNASA